LSGVERTTRYLGKQARLRPFSTRHASRVNGAGMNTPDIRHRLRLVHVLAALVLAACGGEVLGSSNGGDSGSMRDSGSTDASVNDRSIPLDSGHEADSGSADAPGHDSAPGEVGPPNFGDAACGLTTYMCKSQGLSVPCWSCETGESYSQCPSLTANCSAGGNRCFSCDHGSGTIYICDPSHHWFPEQSSVTCNAFQ
jgi:hypothetical protein